jgi:hypothetical protein
LIQSWSNFQIYLDRFKPAASSGAPETVLLELLKIMLSFALLVVISDPTFIPHKLPKKANFLPISFIG